MQLQTDGIMGISHPSFPSKFLKILFTEMLQGRNHLVIVKEFKNNSLDLHLYNISKRILQFEDLDVLNTI